jgi:hypothetical protein
MLEQSLLNGIHLRFLLHNLTLIIKQKQFLFFVRDTHIMKTYNTIHRNKHTSVDQQSSESENQFKFVVKLSLANIV